jgi:cell division protein ZapE
LSTLLSPHERYQRDLNQGLLSPDTAQASAVEALEGVYDALLARRKMQDRHLPLLRRVFRDSPAPVKGLYLWGGVGRGKTYLMDLFYQCLPEERKMRRHFHRFMLMVHRQLNEQQKQKNPLQRVAQDIARDIDVICFDEFSVNDIGDAMILARLLEALFSAGVTLVATSNIAPDKLYDNGLQRANFLPAIALLQQHTRVMQVDGGTDYRLRSLEQAEIYHSPLGLEAEKIMQASFEQLSAGLNTVQAGNIEIQGREIPARQRAEDLVWFDFSAICGGPRSSADYIEIAQLFHTVMISNMPVLDVYSDDKTRRFVNLVDEFYDHKVKLIISAATDLENLYQGTELAFVFERTRSRLLEMQSHDYLALEHMP